MYMYNKNYIYIYNSSESIFGNQSDLDLKPASIISQSYEFGQITVIFTFTYRIRNILPSCSIFEHVRDSK